MASLHINDTSAVGILVEGGVATTAAFFWDNKLCVEFWQNSAIYQIEWQ